MEGEELQAWLNHVVSPIELTAFIRGEYSLLPEETL